MSPNTRNLLGRPLRIILCFMVLGLLFAGLYPYNFIQKNQVVWLPERTGIEFQGYGEAYGASGIELDTGVNSNREFSLEFVVSSLEGSKPSIEKLLSVYERSGGESFALERWTEYLAIAGWFRNRQGQTTYQRLFCGPVFATNARRVITITSGLEGTTVYLEGIRQTYYPDLSLVPRNFNGTVLLGQTYSGHQQWRGTIAGLALYLKVLTPDEIVERSSQWGRTDAPRLRDRTAMLLYTFDEGRGTIVHNHGSLHSDLFLPARFHALRLKGLNIPTRRDFTDWSDITLNVLGFIPLGVLVVAYAWSVSSEGSKPGVLQATLAGFAVSLTIELLQVLLPSRDPTLLDLTMNTLGSWIGARLGVMLPIHIGHTHSLVPNETDLSLRNPPTTSGVTTSSK